VGGSLLLPVTVSSGVRNLPGPEGSRRDSGQRLSDLLERRYPRSRPGAPRLQAKMRKCLHEREHFTVRGNILVCKEVARGLPTPTRDPTRLAIPHALAVASARPGFYRLPGVKKGQGSAGSPLPRTRVLERKGPRTQKIPLNATCAAGRRTPERPSPGAGRRRAAAPKWCR
jgi:hypothetical protein